MPTGLSDFDLYLLAEGTHKRAYEKLGAHPEELNGEAGTEFAVWAPNAEYVSVIGDFNNWNIQAHAMHPSSAGVWERFIPKVASGAIYKYHLKSHYGGYTVDKADPFGFASQIRPETASRVWDLQDFTWSDQEWMAHRSKRNSLDFPVSIYEMHLGSWRRVPEEGNRWLTYREVAPILTDYLQKSGFTHVEFMPLMEHPFDGSWGFEVTGYFAPTSRHGSPTDFMYLVDYLHNHGIGVILDWVPGHFPKDEAGLGFFDGTHLYEHSDPRLGEHPDWNTLVFNYGRNEVQNFLVNNALFWFDKYHVDGLRVDAVASMLYLDYGRSDGQWIPNKFGGKENIEAIHFLRALNESVYGAFPDVMMIAEESTAWPQVSRPTYIGGLGFGMKWNMGWMHDVLGYMSQDPVFRSFHHNQITFSLMYAFSENFVLPFSHDEVVYGKGSMLNKMPGDVWQKFANLRLLYGFMFGHPGKKLLFMGDEFGQRSEWNHDQSLDWHLLANPMHAGLAHWVSDLNRLYRSETALHEQDNDAAGFEWIDCKDSQRSIISFIRTGRNTGEQILFVCNFTPVPRENYLIGVPQEGHWNEVLNSDASIYGGSDVGNFGGLSTSANSVHGRPFSLNMRLPPLGVAVFKHQAQHG